MHFYTYTFEQKWDWKSCDAYAPEIHNYFMAFSKRYVLRYYMKLQHKVIAASWHEEQGQWRITAEHNGNTSTGWCEVTLMPMSCAQTKNFTEPHGICCYPTSNTWLIRHQSDFGLAEAEGRKV
jgi:hypothetical protein